MRNLKRALSLAVASVMLMGMMVVGSSAASYADVDVSDNLEAIEVLKAVGVMVGDENGNFNPDEYVTRNEMAVVMTNLLGLTAGGNSPFTDVPSWAAPYVAACYNNDIIAGVSATEFNGSANVTAVQAGLMVMKALGYFGYQGEFGDGWKVSVVKQANKIDLYDGINAYTDQDMTRNDIAQMVLNALECNVKVVTEQGGLSVSGNGITVDQKPTYKYENAQDKADHNYNGIADGDLQLCEKLYGSDLKKNTDTPDDMGRPCNEWTYGDDSIKTAKQTAIVYTDKVKVKDMYKALGKPTVKSFTYTINGGEVTSNLPAINDSNATELGARGTVIEVYYDADKDALVLAQYDYYLAQADEDYDADDEEVDVTIFGAGVASATLSADDFAVTNVKEEDYLVLTMDGNDVETVVAADVVENVVVSTARTEDYVVADGEKYQYNKIAVANSETITGLMRSNNYDINGDGYNLFLDPNGYVLGVDGYDAGLNLDNYLFIKETSTNGFDAIAKALFMDGTTKTITVAKVNDVEPDDAAWTWADATEANVFYTYDINSDGEYELEDETTSNSTNSTIDNVANPIGAGLAGTTNTVFIAKDKVYTGVKNAPEVKTATDVFYFLDEDGKLAVVYTASKGSSATDADDLVYILNNNPAEAKDGDDTYYIYDAIVNGEATTLDANDDNKPAGLYEIETYTDGRADLGTAIQDLGVTNELVNYVGTVAAGECADGTLTLGSYSFLVSDDVTIITVDTDETVKTISASGVKKAIADGFDTAYAIETSDSNEDIITVYLIK